MRIDRSGLVRRHNPVLRSLDADSPLSVGNGELAFTVDATGLQTFGQHYGSSFPLCTQSQWGWHSFPPSSAEGELRLEQHQTHGRSVGYATSATDQEGLFDALRKNPHRLNLCAVRLCAPEGTIRTDDVRDVNQELDLWTGIIRSSSSMRGLPLRVDIIGRAHV